MDSKLEDLTVEKIRLCKNIEQLEFLWFNNIMGMVGGDQAEAKKLILTKLDNHLHTDPNGLFEEDDPLLK